MITPFGDAMFIIGHHEEPWVEKNLFCLLPGDVVLFDAFAAVVVIPVESDDAAQV